MQGLGGSGRCPACPPMPSLALFEVLAQLEMEASAHEDTRKRLSATEAPKPCHAPPVHAAPPAAFHGHCPSWAMQEQVAQKGELYQEVESMKEELQATQPRMHPGVERARVCRRVSVSQGECVAG